MASLQEVTAALSEALTTDDVITAAVDRAVSALGARTGGLWLVDKKSKVAQLKHSAGDDRAALEGFAEIPLESSTPMPVTSVIRTGKAVWIESSVEFERNYPQLAATIQPRTRDYSLACLPMRVEARCIGALVFNFDVAQKFSEGERFFLLGIAWHSAQALERARLYEAAHAASDWTARLLKVTSAFSRASTAKEVAVIAVSLGVEALQAHGGALWLIGAGADEAELIAEVRMDPAATERFRHISLNANIGPAEAIRTNAPIFLESLRDITNLHLDLQDLSPLAGGSRVYLPISVMGRTLGVLGCSLGTWRSFSLAERSFLMALTNQCAQAMERARLFESEHQAHRDAETNRRRASFLSEASALLSSSLEY
ncbi:MAG TPA: GAF domain-containing protein, partial [Myxococcaceae bacterium]|nr:GAF domain-containing protein [Myxococcaceae bacterium]